MKLNFFLKFSGQHLNQKKIPAFQFYEDSPSGNNKENLQMIGIIFIGNIFIQ